MMGSKKLSTICQELRDALASTGEDPIRWLEERIAAGKRQGAGGTEVLESLKRVLERDGRHKGRKRRVRAKQ